MALKTKREKQVKDLTTNKLYIFMDWVWKLFALNFLTLICSLGVVTFYPALVSCFMTIKDIKEDDEVHFIKKYFYNFKYCFLDVLPIGIVVAVVMAVFLYAYLYYSDVIEGLRENGGYTGWVNIYSVLLGFTMVFYIVLSLVMVQMPMVLTYFHFRFFDKIRFSFYMAYRHLGKSMLIVLAIIIDVLLCVFLPSFIFVCFSLPLFISYISTKKEYHALLEQSNDEYENDEYDMQGKTKNRENYEDSDYDYKAKEAEERLGKINEDINKGRK